MIYSYGGRVDNDSNAITEIDEENRTAETKGYVNGEYVEFSSGGGGEDSLPVVKYSVDANITSITCDTSFANVVNLIQNGIPFLLFVFFDGDGTDIALFPTGITSRIDSVYFEMSFGGLDFGITHTADSITIDPLTE